MAEIRLQVPDPLNFKSPDDWNRWSKRFEQFRMASGLDKDPEEKQVNTLLYCMGEEAEAILDSTKITADEKKDYNTVVEKFNDFFKVRRNVIFERARFNRRNQQDGETVEEYIMDLYKLAENCNYGNLKEEMIRDRLVVGISDRKLSERMQLDPELDLEKAKKMTRQREAIRDQTRALKRGDDQLTEEVGACWKARRSLQKRHLFKKPIGSQQNDRGRLREGKHCTRCGKDAHTTSEKCPARDAICHNCRKRGHYSKQCFNRTDRTKSVSELGLEEQFQLDTVTHSPTGTGDNRWMTKILLQGKETTFKIDTGAEVTVISEETFRRLGKLSLKKAPKTLCGPTRQLLRVLGTFEGKLTHKDQTSEQQIYVVQGFKTNLLGLPAITALEIVTRIGAITTDGHTVEEAVHQQFPSLFRGLGNLGEEYIIRLKPEAKPHSLFTARRIPLPLREKVKNELDRMESTGVISKVEEPTPWCAGMVPILKRDGTVRICVDLKRLNENVLREVFPLPQVDEALAQLTGAKLFTKLDANSGFWQVPLAKESRLLTTFVTPFGRYCFNKLPFGISSAPEHFQKQMNRILTGLEGVICLMDDVLIFGSNKEEHNSRLTAALKQIQAAGATLNKRKCEFGCDNLLFLGHLINSDGIRADPAKTAAIKEMKPPTCISELRRFMGLVNQVGKFSRNLADLTHPLRMLLSTRNSWTWGKAQEEAFENVKKELLKPTTLALYDPKAKTKVSADASSYGLGAVLLQQQGDNWRPVAFASRSLTDTETRYAQIEKEALASTWSCEKFSSYLLGMRFEIETDHKPLIPLLGTKELDQLPPRVLRFRLRLSKFDYSITHVPGKLLYTADALSRDPLPHTEDDTSKEDECLIAAQVSCLPASKTKLEEYREKQHADPICSTVINYCLSSWPEKNAVNESVKPYWNKQGELTVCDGLLLYGNRIVVPKSLQRQALTKLHDGHQGIQRTCSRARTAVWWPGIQHEIINLVKQCDECIKKATPRREPMISSQLPQYPWQRVATDLFVLKGTNYILVIDYFSRYLEVRKLSSTTTSSVIHALKMIFSQHGIPEEVVSDNGPQYTSQEFEEFTSTYDFHHTTSSPYFPRSNGMAERGVRTAKQLLKSAKDPYMALLSYHSTPLPWCKLSPAELLMGRCIRSNIPLFQEKLIPDSKSNSRNLIPDQTYIFKFFISFQLPMNMVSCMVNLFDSHLPCML